MTAKRTAEAVWENDLIHGSGRVKGTSGALPEVAVSWASRTEAPGGKTSPEELLAAAHASCYSMAFSNALAKIGHPPQRLNVQATATFDKVGDSFAVTTMDLVVRGKVAGIDAPKFQEAAEQAAAGCPISKALKGNVAVHVTATLEPAAA
jgi:lipoyl-dependent peroxiredoxin